MSQHDFDIANQAGAAFRGDLNNALQALASQSAGSSAPATTFAYQIWIDTANDLIKQRNAANSAWITVGSFTAGKTLRAGTPLVLNPYAVGATTTQAHGLGAAPDMYTGYLECISATVNYSVGDRIDLFGHGITDANNANVSGMIIQSDATNVNLITSATNTIVILNKTTRAGVYLTFGSWLVSITPWRIGG